MSASLSPAGALDDPVTDFSSERRQAMGNAIIVQA
jgi:hypothetical protein